MFCQPLSINGFKTECLWIKLEILLLDYLLDVLTTSDMPIKLWSVSSKLERKYDVALKVWNNKCWLDKKYYCYYQTVGVKLLFS